jgi:hypothetical protein
MSFVFDIPLLLIMGFFIGKYFYEKRFLLSCVVILIFYFVGMIWYFTDKFMFLPGYGLGSDFMLNSWVFGHYFSRSFFIDVVAIILFLLYPLWLYLGIKLSKK